MNSVSGVTYRVKDLKKTVKFYETLGFTVTKNEPDFFSVRLNWFWINFIVHPHASGSNDQTLYISVDSVDEIYNELSEKGFEFTTEPQDYPSGKREAMLSDPDGNYLVFFSKK